METRPTEWSFSQRGSYYDGYPQIISHEKSGISLQATYEYSKSNKPKNIRFWVTGSQPSIVDNDFTALRNAIVQLQYDRVNTKAAKFLKIESPIICSICKEKCKGWSWICKCQTALDHDCYNNVNVCPECGANLVNL
jgi:hypothetical protein